MLPAKFALHVRENLWSRLVPLKIYYPPTRTSENAKSADFVAAPKTMFPHPRTVPNDSNKNPH